MKNLTQYFRVSNYKSIGLCLLLIAGYCGSAQDPILDNTLESDLAESWFGYSVANAGDVNGDGYTDFIIGDPWYDNGETDEGRVYIYHGAADGINTEPALILEGDQVNAFFGWSVSGAGDINADGFGDIIIGARGYSNPNIAEGRAYIYFGSPTGINVLSVTTRESNKTSAEMGYSVSAAGDVNNDGYDDVIVGAHWDKNGQDGEGRVYIYHGSATGLNMVASTILEGNQVMAEFGRSVSNAGDVNNDGYDDVIIGAFAFDNGEDNEGRVYIFHGASSGVLTTPAVTMEINQVGALFGATVSGAGDINGDGFGDVIAAAVNYDNVEVDEGLVYAYFGSVSGINPIPGFAREGNSNYMQLGFSLSEAGDINDDGYSDFLIASDNGPMAYLLLGSATGVNESYDRAFECGQYEAYFGWSLGGSGDINGDGFSDFIIGAPRYDGDQMNEGRAFVYLGNDCDSVFYRDLDGDGFGDPDDPYLGCTLPAGYVYDSSDCADDNAMINPLTVWYFDNDLDHYYAGGGDPITSCVSPGANYDTEPPILPGDCNDALASVYPGAPEYTDGLDNDCNGLIDDGVPPVYDAFIQSNQVYAHLGVSVANAGDVNGDGYDDAIASANNFSNPESDEGVVFIYHGSAEGISLTPSTWIEGNATDYLLGSMVSCAGDINNDGYDDVIIGAQDRSSPEYHEGCANIYFGGPEGINPTPAFTLEANQAGANFGVSVSGEIDVNADGYDDVIVGAQYFDNGQTDEGRVYVFHGSPTGLITTPASIMESDQAYAYFGREISGAGDVNGDGYDDIIVGADNYDNPESGEGRSYIFHGSATGIITTPATILEVNISDASLGTVSRAGDVNGDGYADVIIGACGSGADRAYVFEGSPSGILPTPSTIINSPTAAYEFYGRVADAGDINNDGFDDVIIGSIYYSNGQAYEGGAFVHLGSVSGVNAVPYMSLEGDMPYAYFGRSCSGAGDVNGDGYDDLVVGSYGYSNPEYEEGAIFFYYGEEATGYCVEPPTGLTYDWDPWYWMMVKFKWDAVPGAIAYRVRYKRTDEPEWNYKFSGAGKNRIVIQYWDCFVDYEVQVMAICSEDGTDASPYSEPLIFNTEVLDYCYREGGPEPVMHIFPNPATDNVTISLAGIREKGTIVISNAEGQTVFSMSFDSNEEEVITWNAATVSNGLYLVELILPDRTITQKCLIAR